MVEFTDWTARYGVISVGPQDKWKGGFFLNPGKNKDNRQFTGYIIKNRIKTEFYGI